MQFSGKNWSNSRLAAQLEVGAPNPRETPDLSLMEPPEIVFLKGKNTASHISVIIHKAVADPGFPRRGRQQQGGGTSLLFGQNFPKNYMKMKTIEPGGGPRPRHTVLWIRQCKANCCRPEHSSEAVLAGGSISLLCVIPMAQSLT